MSWKLSTTGAKAAIEGALEAREHTIGWDENIVLAGFEIAEDQPDIWLLDAYFASKPSAAERKAIASLFAKKPPKFTVQELPETDWISESQKGVDPIRAGRFYVHTPDHPPSDDNEAVNFCIPAAQAFGTGQHETTAGCLAMLDKMAGLGLNPRNVADIGTGTGLLAFAARALWPLARFTVSDIDPLCVEAVETNAASNNVPLGTIPGKLTNILADGMDATELKNRAPFDLLIANILAGPLIDMAPDFAKAVKPRGSILLAGLLEEQEQAVRLAYFKEGFRLHKKYINGDWSILWLRQRFAG